MKITYLLTNVDATGGTERAVLDQASWTSQHHEVEVLSVYRETGTPFFPVSDRVRIRYALPTPPPTEDRPGAPSSLIPPAWDRDFTTEVDRRLPQMLARIKADVVVAPTPPLAALAVRHVAGSVAVIEAEHRPTAQRGPTIGPILTHGAELDALVSLTRRSTEWIQDKLGVRAPRLATIPNTVPVRHHPRASLSNPLIVAAGRMVAQKNFGDLIKAFAMIAHEYPEWRLRIYGEGPHEARHRALTRALGVQDRVELVPFVSDMAAEWSKGSVFALSSRVEGLPLVMLEAAAAGLPLVAYDCPTGPAEILEVGGGELVPFGSVSSLASALRRFVSDPEARRAAGAAALAGTRRYHPDVVGRAWLELLEEVVADVRRRPSRAERSARRIVAATAAARAADAAAEILDASEPGPVVPDASFRTVASGALRQEACDAVVAALEGARVPFVRLDVPSRPTLAVASEQMPNALEAIAKVAAEAPGAEMTARQAGQLLCPPWRPEAGEPTPQNATLADVVTITRAATDSRGVVHPSAWLVEVEAWYLGEDGFYAPTRPNSRRDRLKPELLGADSPDGGVLTEDATPLWSTPTFPIDAVYTWVDDTDVTWRAARDRALGRPVDGTGADSTRAARFRNRDELRYSLRALLTYAPWIRHVYIVTADQHPAWLDPQNERVTVVPHSAIFPDPSDLPTFSSHAIETTLHRIPGLSEHFLYLNDDTILMRPQRPEQYFEANGLPRFFTSSVKINYGMGDEFPHLEAASNNRDLLRRDFGAEITSSMLHTPHPHRKSVLAEIEERYAEQVMATRSRQFRSGRDVSMLSSLGQYYGYFTGRYVPGSLRYRYVSLGRPGLRALFRSLAAGDGVDTIALGEPADERVNMRAIDMHVEDFFHTIQPEPSEAEIVADASPAADLPLQA